MQMSEWMKERENNKKLKTETDIVEVESETVYGIQSNWTEMQCWRIVGFELYNYILYIVYTI